MFTKQVAIVIPNWNGSSRLRVLLEALSAQTYPIARVLVVDNGSTDDSIDIAKRAGADVIALSRNTGFAVAVNHGIRAATTEAVAVVNNDVVPEPDWLEKLMKPIEGGAWFAVGKLLNSSERERIDGCFDAISRGATAWRCGHNRLDGPIWSKPREVRFPPWTAAVFRADLFEKVGLLDETFESYLEDVDFGLRCAAHGFSGSYVPAAVAYHQGSATLGRWHPATVRKMARNQLLLIAKHYPRKWILRYGWPILLAQSLWGFSAFRHGTLLAFLKGKMDGLRLFQKVRGKSQASIPAILEQSEREILELQKATGVDLYWRVYFALT